MTDSPKIVVQIPCFNESKNIRAVIEDIRLNCEPNLYILVIDDGSSDGTFEAASSAGADYVLRIPKHQGLAQAFQLGVRYSLSMGADVIVNTDGDHQYCASDIAKLVEPILSGRAELSIGQRPTARLDGASKAKRWLDGLGNRVMGTLTGKNLVDCRSGFRAFSRKFATELRLHSRYTYTLETLLQACFENFPLALVPIDCREVERPSRLIKNIPSDIIQCSLSILTSVARYQREKFFGLFSILFLIPALWISTTQRIFNQPLNTEGTFVIALSLLLSFASLWTSGILRNSARAPAKRPVEA